VEEWGRVNAIAPGFMATEGFLKLLGGREGPNKETSPMTQNIPLGRWGDPGDIAGLVVYLISDAASYITGQCEWYSRGSFLTERR
jgi:NAD(P)-dependent dehydrogenase (short-subunit alcohol dehydrogenase family)